MNGLDGSRRESSLLALALDSRVGEHRAEGTGQCGSNGRERRVRGHGGVCKLRNESTVVGRWMVETGEDAYAWNELTVTLSSPRLWWDQG